MVGWELGFGVVTNINNKIIFHNKQKLPKIYNKYTSHRREAFGVLSSFRLLEKLRIFCNRSKLNNMKTEALILCDNESVTTTLAKFDKQSANLKDYYSADYDILNETSKTWKKLKTKKYILKSNT
jgi:hypothetical protein